MTWTVTAEDVGAASYRIVNAPPRVPRLWPGETFVILGGGPSLTPADVNYVRGKTRVIAVKEAVQLAPWADALYAADWYWWKFYQGMPSFTGLMYTTEVSTTDPTTGIRTTAPPQTTWTGVTVLRNTGDEGLELDPSGIRTGHNSGYQAINVAVHLGAARIILLGFDLWHGPQGQNWYTPPLGYPKRQSQFPVFLQMFSTLAEPLKAAGVEVINCSRQTVLTAFPKMSLEEALP